MSHNYERKQGVNRRGHRCEEILQEAIKIIQAGEIKKREARPYYGLSVRTLCHGIETATFKKIGLGPQVSLGQANDKRLVKHIQRLGAETNKQTVRHVAYNFAQTLSVKSHTSSLSRNGGLCLAYFNPTTKSERFH
jgi:hypothetical protein